MTIIALLIYSALIIFILYRVIRKRTVSLSLPELSLAFVLKVALGCAYGYIFLHYYDGDDTWLIHKESLEETDKLIHDPIQFIKDFSPVGPYRWAGGGFWAGIAAWLNTLENFCISKTIGIFNLLTGSNYYVNVAFFNGIVFWGHYWLFGLLTTTFPGKRLALLLLIFFFPPILFWLSGIRADGMLLFFLSLLLVHFNKYLTTNNKRSIIYVLLALLGILIFRRGFLMPLLPALAAWFVSVRFSKKPLYTFILVYVVCGILFFASGLFFNTTNLPKAIAHRQQEYLALEGTRFPLDTLKPNFIGYLKVLPQAINNTFFRPYLWEAKGALQLMTALEIIAYWLLVLLPFFRKDKRWRSYLTHPLLLFCLFFGLSLYLFIGFTVPFPGAIVRYRILAALLLLSIPLVCTRWATRSVD